MNNEDSTKSIFNRPIYSHDPNFPAGLKITPSSLSRKQLQSSTNKDQDSFDRDNQQDIEDYGIAGRIWEAAYALKLYLTPDAPNEVLQSSSNRDINSHSLEFDPPCSIFDPKKRITALELGSGAGYVGLHLSQALSNFRTSLQSNQPHLSARENEVKETKSNSESNSCKDVIILTDLDNVCPLLSRNASRASIRNQSNTSDSNLSNQKKLSTELYDFNFGEEVEVKVRPLCWGDESQALKISEELKTNRQAPSSNSSSFEISKSNESEEKKITEKENHLQYQNPITHIILSDLVYFPELLPPLLRSLITLTEPLLPSRFNWKETINEEIEEEEAKSPEIIIAYKIRSLAKEEPFWRALESWFDFHSVSCTDKASFSLKKEKQRWRRFGKELKDLKPPSSKQGNLYEKNLESGLGVDNSIDENGSHSKEVEAEVEVEVVEEEEGDEIFIFVAKRKKSSIGCLSPKDDDSLMSGKKSRIIRKQKEQKKENKSNNSETQEKAAEIELREKEKENERSSLEKESKFDEEKEEFFEEDEGIGGDGFELILLGDIEI